MKDKIYNIYCTVPVSLKAVLEELPMILQNDPKEGAKVIMSFFQDGDWSLDYEVMKLLKKDLKIDFGKEAADHMQAILDIMDRPEE